MRVVATLGPARRWTRADPEGHTRKVLAVGTVLAGRFVITGEASAGGMGSVHRATDRETGDVVAVKVVEGTGDGVGVRFADEAVALAEIEHPNVVRYVAHGTGPDGNPFLAMEWLEGVDLAERLRQGALSLDDSLSLLSRIASALSAAHARGIVHRDVKPSNIFLEGADPTRSKLLDFGVARRSASARRLTATGAAIGTIGYMAPEQARGLSPITPAADVFALGCVVFECLTGTPAFGLGPAVATLAKVLCDAPPLVSDMVPNVPTDLVELVACMLAKDPGLRPPDGASVWEALASLRRSVRAPGSELRDVSLSSRERRLVGVVLGDYGGGELGHTLTPREVEDAFTSARKVVVALGGDVACMTDGAIVATITGETSATALAARAAQVGLTLGESMAKLRIAIAIGQAEVDRVSPVGPAIDRAAALLAQETAHAFSVRVDDATHGLLDDRFATIVDGGVRVLLGRRKETDPPRTLLGRATECVGRAKEIALVEATLEECFTESSSRVVLVTAPPGTGKSRLRRELVSRATAAREMLVLAARGDPLAGGEALGLIRQLLRSNFPDDDVFFAAVRSRLRRRNDAARADRLAAFLDEVVGAGALRRDPLPEIRAARNDPRLMREWVELAFREWLASECALRPVLVVLEDLHCGDIASISFFDEALRALADRPLFVLGLSHPDQPRLVVFGSGRGRQTIALAPLTQRACESLAREVLGGAVDAAVVARVAERADGNAFFLEELIRAVAEGREEEWPDTVLAMAHGRLAALSPEERRILRAASVFGERFDRTGVEALLGTSDDPKAIAAAFPRLVAQELLEPILGEQQTFRFRHGLLREAAYGMLTEEDRKRGHWLAATWLEGLGEKEPTVLAEHRLRTAEPERAVPWLVLAAHGAEEGGDLDGALALAARARDLGASGSLLGALLVIEGQVLCRKGEWEGALAAAGQAVRSLPAGDTRWWAAVSWASLSAAHLGDVVTATELMRRVMEFTTDPEPSGPFGFAILILSTALFHVGQRSLALAMGQRALALPSGGRDDDPAFRAWRAMVGSNRAMWAEDDPAGGLRNASEACDLFDGIGDRMGMPYARAHLAFHLHEAGAYARAEAVALEAKGLLGELGQQMLTPWLEMQLAMARAYRGEVAQARRDLLAAAQTWSSGLLTLFARGIAAELALLLGEPATARAEATTLRDQAQSTGVVHLHALGVLAQASYELGDHEAAVAFAETALSLEGDAVVVSRAKTAYRLARARALAALGRTDEARRALAQAASRIEQMASGFDDAALATAFRTCVARNAATLGY